MLRHPRALHVHPLARGLLLAVSLPALAMGCSDRDEEPPAPESQRSDEQAQTSVATDSASGLDSRVGIWEPGEDAMHVRFALPVPTESAGALVEAFNERFDDPFYPELILHSVDRGVARVGFSDDAQLSNRMGTTGSAVYAASLVLTLTSLPEVDSVYFDIEEGSHAGPVYNSRRDVEYWASEESPPRGM